MTGGAETPPNASTATGTCTLSINETTDTVTFGGTFTGLGGNATAASIRGLAGPGAVAPVILPASTVTNALAGSFSGGGSITSSEVSGMLAGNAYCEVDDTVFASGEIRGQLAPPPPTPALPPLGVAMLSLGLAAVGVRHATRWRRT